MTWEAASRTATFAIDNHHVDGNRFIPDVILSPVFGGDNGFTTDNSHLFFGGAGDAVFSNLDLDVALEPEPDGLFMDGFEEP